MEASAVRFRAAADVETSGVGDRVVLYHRGSKKALVLNPTGSFLWARLDGPRSKDELTGFLLERYPALEPARARLDTDAFVAELALHQMLA